MALDKTVTKAFAEPEGYAFPTSPTKMLLTHGRKARRIITFFIVLLLVLYQYAQFTGYFEYTIPNMSVLKKSALSRLQTTSARMDEMKLVGRLLPHLDHDGCSWTAPQRLNETSEITDPSRTLLVSYPGSGKRMAWRMLEGFTGLVAGDDWDLSTEGRNTLTMKTSYPHHEGIWNWGFNFYDADVVLLLRNPRWAIPSYQTMRYELGYSSTWAESFRRIAKTYTNRSSVEEWVEWRGDTWPNEYKKGHFEYEIKLWGRFIDFWMNDGLRRYDSDGNPVTDWHCRNKVIRCCQPKVIISFENLKDEDLGVFEVDKLLDALENGENRTTFPRIPKDSRKCIFHEIQEMGEENTQWDNKNRDNGGPKHYTRDLTWVQLNMMKEEMERLITKYTGSDYDNSTVAEQLVTILHGYYETVTREWRLEPPYSWEPTPAPTPAPTQP